MEHKHLFRNIGGGCYLDGRDYPCDEHYKCKCGFEFKVKTTETGHRFLPEIFEETEMSEIKEFEQNEIIKTKIENQKNDTSTILGIS